MANAKFIYVYGTKERDVLLSMGYQLFQSDEPKHIYIFLNNEPDKLMFADISYITSNQLLL